MLWARGAHGVRLQAPNCCRIAGCTVQYVALKRLHGPWVASATGKVTQRVSSFGPAPASK